MRNALLIVVIVALSFTRLQRAAGQISPVAADEHLVSRQLAPAAYDRARGAPAAANMVPGAHEQLDAALWVQTSAEFYAIARQTFSSATEKLDLALRDPTWTA